MLIQNLKQKIQGNNKPGTWRNMKSMRSAPKYNSAAAAVTLVVSDSVRPHRWQPTRLPRTWDSPGKNTGVVAISFSNAWKWKVKVKSQSCPTPSNPMDCSPPGSSIHGIFQAREWSGLPLPSPKYNCRCDYFHL